MKRFLFVGFAMISVWMSGLQARDTDASSRKGGETTLRSLADRAGVRWGGALAAWALAGDEDYREAVLADFNSFTPENCLKMRVVSKQPSVYHFGEIDAMLAFAEANGLSARGHTLVWHNQLPAWTDDRVPEEGEAAQFLERYIRTVMGRYEGRFRAWDVVNEAIDKGELRKTYWWKHIGPDYIEKAFTWAREADPGAKLYYNDYAILKGGPKADRVYELLKDLKARGVPVDGIGFQAHLRVDQDLPWDRIPANLARFRELGLELAVTELDIRIPEPVTPEKLEAQAAMAERLVRLLLKEGVRDITFWGVTDKASWISSFFEDYDAGLMRDRSLSPKPMHDRLRAVLEKAAEAAP